MGGVDILPALKDRDSYFVRAGVEPVRVASVGSCFVEAAGAGGAAAGARLTSSPHRQSAPASAGSVLPRGRSRCSAGSCTRRVPAAGESRFHPMVVGTIGLHIAHPVKNHGRQVRASRLNGLPLVPASVEVLVVAEFGFFQVVGQRIGKLDLQLL